MVHKATDEECVAWLERLVAFDTTSRNSNMELIEEVRSYLDGLGIECRLTQNEEGNKANLWATIGPASRGGIVLSGHTDVVPIDGQDWTQTDPFKAERRDGRLYGRGTADMKGFIACVLSNAERMAAEPLRTPFHFAFSYDEEVGCTGVLSLVRDMSANLPTPQAVIVGEPTSMQLVGGHKGGRSWHTTVTGVDGHSSMPDLGANAIMGASRIIVFLQEMQQRLRDKADTSNGFTPPYTTVDCGLIEGGTAHNVIPSKCTFTFGFRTVPGEDAAVLAREVFDFIETEIEPDLKRIGAMMEKPAGVHCEERHHLPNMDPDETSAAETLIRHLTGLNESGRVSYGTEAPHFQQAGVPAVVFGPGSIDQAHLPDEFIDIEQLDQCNAFLHQLTDWARTNGEIR